MRCLSICCSSSRAKGFAGGKGGVSSVSSGCVM